MWLPPDLEEVKRPLVYDSTHFEYLRKLKDRICARGFPENDLLHVVAVKAVAASEQLHRQAEIRARTYRRPAEKSRGS